jgi:L-erythro-3,5-diaminohexanoate dehydrogenase
MASDLPVSAFAEKGAEIGAENGVRVKFAGSEKADAFGTHRSLEPAGSLPQPAQRVDNDFSRLFAGEMLLAVETLNVDAASFRQMEEAAVAAGEADASDAAAVGRAVAQRVLATVKARGKQHNPVTGSGGMLLGRVIALAPGRDQLVGAAPAAVGDRVATLVSLSLTPLCIDLIGEVRATSAQLDVTGKAVLFASGAFARMPADMADRLALAVLDVAGAAPQVARLVKPGNTTLVLGAGGKSGILCAAEARRQAGPSGKVIGVESYAAYADDLRALGLCDEVIVADARDAVAVRAAVLAATDGREADVAFSCVNVPDAEMATILCTRDRGVAYFFAMSTSFTKSALGAEGVGKDVDLMMGNGYAHGHADHTLQMMRDFPQVRALFERRYT